MIAAPTRRRQGLTEEGVPHWFIKNDAQGNHKVSAQKFGIVQGFIHLGCSVLLTDTDVVYMADPFTSLYRDSDIESMSDGWDNKTLHGDIEPIVDHAMGYAYNVPATMRMAALNSGCGTWPPRCPPSASCRSWRTGWRPRSYGTRLPSTTHADRRARTTTQTSATGRSR